MSSTMNPYEADPSKVPASDRYFAEPLFGRYLPRADDFVPAAEHIMSETPESLTYWASVLQRCDESARVFDNEFGGRDVFALGSVIVKSSHLKAAAPTLDFALADRNEVKALELARGVLDVPVPRIYFAGMIHGRPVLVQERIPGVCLSVAWQYLSLQQKESFKQQTRAVLQQMYSIKPPHGEYGYVEPDMDPLLHRGVREDEPDMLFGDHVDKNDARLMHNDMSISNLIVDDDRIVGVVDWEMAGWFSWDAAAEVHAKVRSPQPESYASLDLPKDVLDELFFWNDLFDCGPVGK